MIENPYTQTEDKILFAKILDRLNAAIKKRQSAFSDFLDPTRCAAFFAYLEYKIPQEITLQAHGGHENAERKLLGFITGETALGAPFPITPISVTYNQKFAKPPTHRDYLGAVIGLGLERAKLGDIIITPEGAAIFTQTDIAPYICENLTQAGRTSVKAQISQPAAILPTEKGTQKRVTVPSMRLDAIMASAFNISRAKAAQLIESEKVFVNWKPAKKTQQITPPTTITIRGIGRVTIDEQQGSTKKDRTVLLVTKYF